MIKFMREKNEFRAKIGEVWSWSIAVLMRHFLNAKDAGDAKEYKLFAFLFAPSAPFAFKSGIAPYLPRCLNYAVILNSFGCGALDRICLRNSHTCLIFSFANAT